MTTTRSTVDYPQAPVDVSRLQRRTLAVLSLSQVLGSFGTTVGIAVGVLLASTLASTAVSGLAQSVAVIGQGLLAVPVSRLMDRRGRRAGLAVAYAIGTGGAIVTVLAAAMRSAPLLLLGLLLFGGASTGNYQTRYAAADLPSPARRGRHIALILWAATIGAVLGPSLAATTDGVATAVGFAPFAGPFLASAVGFALAAAVLALLLRPDPLLSARQLSGAAPAPAPNAPTAGLRVALREIRASPRARLGVTSIGAGHASMMAIMAMTGVYIGRLGHSHDDTLRILGVTIAAHVIGMYAFSPLIGALADRAGRRVVMLGGHALLLAACAVAGTAGRNTVQLSFGLFLVGLGWSATLVAGSAMLTEAVRPELRPAVQGAGDLLMTLAAATAGVLAGIVTAWAGFPTLTAVVAVGLVPVIALTLRQTSHKDHPVPRG